MRDPGEELGLTLNSTRMIRLGLDAMWYAVDSLPDEAAATAAVRQALLTISQWLEQAERTALRDGQLTRQYLLIRPVNLASPPSAQSMAQITAAVSTLDGHGLIVTDNDG
jgi:hypothetical protein